MSVNLLQGDCRAVLKTLPEASVHTVVTSPPYWGLRDYGVADQIGLEETPESHVAVLVEVFREVKRVLRPDATCWINYGDCFQNKQLLGMPWRVAFALRAEGWWLRSAITVCKGNPMPESVTNRCTSATEMLFMLTKQPTYYFDQEAIREKHTGPVFNGRAGVSRDEFEPNRPDGPLTRERFWNTDRQYHPAGRNKRNWWVINSQPLVGENHFAAFPEALVIPCIQAGSSEWGVCPECGAPWTRTVEKKSIPTRPGYSSVTEQTKDHFIAKGSGGNTNLRYRTMSETRTTGWQPSCGCGHPDTVPATVLDPFAGSGTVGKVATKLGRRSILIELSPEYCAIAERRNAQLGLML